MEPQKFVTPEHLGMFAAQVAGYIGQVKDSLPVYREADAEEIQQMLNEALPIGNSAAPEA